MTNSTICAIATPAGGAIGIIRLSGDNAITYANALFKPQGKKALMERANHSLTFGTIVNPENGDIIDEVLVSLFRAPHSYTGEDSIEISCHGSSYILSTILQLFIQQGAQLATAGEFTKRAFLNGKMDLSQAEAVADLIASSTAANHRIALQQMRGDFSNELHQLHDHLLHLTSLLELELDFSDHEDLEFASRTELTQIASTIEKHITQLCESFRLGNALKNGLPIAIVGETNVGKSTLLNGLLGEERALVSNIHGTTRDTIEETYIIADTLVRFIDTAGIRTTTDKVEQLGIKRTFQKMEEAQIILWMIDATNALEQFNFLSEIILQTEANVLIILNKRDKLSQVEANSLISQFTNLLPQKQNVSSCPTFSLISARSSDDINFVRQQIADLLHQLTNLSLDSDIIVSNVRHYEALTHALTAIQRVNEGLSINLPGDLISQDLRECLHYLGEIIGTISTDLVLKNIFSHFCIGK